ncbi:MAG TPA: GNAT family N-acetyltransferase [Rhodocyclaceae bacterium]|nr:GNAT family N-acetyltransferase [Rhodocyclaceae bacterium]
METRILDSLSEVRPEQWDALACHRPLLRHAFLEALRLSGCACPETGWHPRHLTLWEGGDLVAALPLYVKDHSYGEFVFDWSWAEAYQRHGLAYYPKLVANVPFTPVPGPRLLARDEVSRERLLATALDHARASGTSSLHILFPTADEAALMSAAGMMIRKGVQFHWRNPGYRDFEDYLSALTRDKRKKVRQERRRVVDAGVRLARLTGGEIGDDDWTFFHRCYRLTYELRGRRPYLNLDFFLRLGRMMPENILLVLAERDGLPIAAALNLHDRDRLYGRYWGAVEDVPCLHFEACYYQAIEFAIERGIGVFEGGAQGEHKLARGFLPTETLSAHWLARPEFAAAVGRFLAQETQGVDRYVDELGEHNPFKA